MPRKTGRKRGKGKARKSRAGGASPRESRWQNSEGDPGVDGSAAVAKGGTAEEAERVCSNREEGGCRRKKGEQNSEGHVDDCSAKEAAQKAGVKDTTLNIANAKTDASEGETGSGDSSAYTSEGYLPNMDRFSKQIDITSGVDDGKYVKDGKPTAEYVKGHYTAFMKDLESMYNAGLVGKRSAEEERAAELHEAALFKGHPRQDDCPVCFLPLPVKADQKTYKVCCGTILCDGCVHEMRERGSFYKDVCPFCRDAIMHGDTLERVLKRANLDDPNALMILASIHLEGKYGKKKDYTRAFELMVKAAELGSAEAQVSLGNTYLHGVGVEKDMWKASRYLERAAMNGSVEARHLLGSFMGSLGQTATGSGRAVEHLMIAAKAGYEPSLKVLKSAFLRGYATKGEYEQSLRGYYESVKETQSLQRDKAAAWYARNGHP